MVAEFAFQPPGENTVSLNCDYYIRVLPRALCNQARKQQTSVHNLGEYIYSSQSDAWQSGA